MAAHHEVHFEQYITEQLVNNGWKEGHSSHYDQQRAIYPQDVMDWVKATQPDAWHKLNKMHGANAEQVLLERLEKALASKTGGTINVLRKGFTIAGCGTIAMGQRKPEDARNDERIARYEHNILRVVRQLKYCPTREWEIDLVLFINGLPVATAELKTDFTQSIESAIAQYKQDRLPIDPKTKRKEPLLTFKRGAVVHFAMSDTEIAMATKLAGENTYFLPFNKGHDGSSSDLPVHINLPGEDGEYPVSYFWQEIAQKDNWLRIFYSFVYVETKEVADSNGKAARKETQIFPRYHQLDAVNKMIDDARQNGAGMQYLCEHSAGSGKTSTIAWTAHDLIRLRSTDGKAVFKSVIIVTDRTVLDSQLQDAVQQLDHQYGVIKAIDREKSSESKSKQLTEALLTGTPIIVVTIQTFPYALEAILTNQSLAQSNFAVIIDEAHTSQTGSTAKGLRAALTLNLSPQELEKMSIEEILTKVQEARTMPKNVSHFAFTATPKHSTKMLFGRPKDPSQPVSDENKPESFHLYTQRQAIDEGFILDVLKNYTHYDTAYKIGENNLDEKRVDSKQARRALARWMSLHPTTVSQKVEFIIEHFKANIAHLLDGEAKAMVVTSGRPQAVKYKLAFDKYIKKHGIEGIQALVAFSGKVSGKDLGDEDSQDPLGIDFDKEYTEYNLNPDTYGADLRHEFEKTEYRVMLVANKFQTGFNQPKLVAMYLDKKISDVEAVQTLSRLNRTYPGKDTTYVIDFANEPQTILNAFKKYDKGAQLNEVQDVNVIYDIKEILDEQSIYNHQDLELFKQARGKSILGQAPDKKSHAHKKLLAATQRPTDVFNVKLKELVDAANHWDQQYNKAHLAGDEKAANYAESQRSEFTKQREALMRFKSDLARFVKHYSYMAQLIEFGDPELENFAAFAHLLARRLKGVTPENIDLSALVLEKYKIKHSTTDFPDGVAEPLRPITPNPSDPNDREKVFLKDIIRRLNELFGDVGDEPGRQNFANGTITRVTQNPIVVEQVEKHDKSIALKGDLPQAVKQAVVQALLKEGDIARTLLKDPQVMASYVELIFDMMKKNSSIDEQITLG
ncbi:TPA: type I restriction endonuclease subunit R [Photobacterium damselae]